MAKKLIWLLLAFTFGFAFLPAMSAFLELIKQNSGNLFVAFCGTFLGAFLSFGIARWIQSEQLKKDADIKKNNLRTRQKEHLSYLSGVLADIITYGQAQLAEVERFIAKIEAEPTIFHPLGLIASESISRLSRADSEETFHAYNAIFSGHPERDKIYNSLLSKTDLLTMALGQVRQSFDNYRTAVYKNQLRIKELVEKSANENAKLLRFLKEGRPKNLGFADGTEPFDTLNKLQGKFGSLSDGEEPLVGYIDSFVVPLVQCLSQYDRELPEQGVELRMLLRDTRVAFTDLKKGGLDFLRAFEPKKLRDPLDAVAELKKKLDQGLT